MKSRKEKFIRGGGGEEAAWRMEQWCRCGGEESDEGVRGFMYLYLNVTNYKMPGYGSEYRADEGRATAVLCCSPWLRAPLPPASACITMSPRHQQKRGGEWRVEREGRRDQEGGGGVGFASKISIHSPKMMTCYNSVTLSTWTG